MEAIRTLGRMPKETKTAPKDEQKLARRLREARRRGKLSAENEKELSAFSERQAVEAESNDASSTPNRLRTAEREGQLSADEKEELKVLRCAWAALLSEQTPALLSLEISLA